MRYFRISRVSSFFKTPDYLEFVEATKKADRTRLFKKATSIGTRVDSLIKTGKEPVKKDCGEVVGAYKGFLKWQVNYPNFGIEAASRLYNDLYQITGEPDLYINKNEICDIKCATSIRLEYWIQQGGYLLLPNIHKIERVSILRLDKTGSDYEYIVKSKPEELHELKMLFVGELNKVRAYLRDKEKERKYGGENLYHDRVSGSVCGEVAG